MRVEYWKCDRCGKKITAMNRMLIQRMQPKDGKMELTAGQDDSEVEEKDFCDECICAIIEYATEPPKEGDRPVEKAKPLEWDKAKAVALSKAGWTAKKIADELNVAEITVKAFIRAYEAANGRAKAAKAKPLEKWAKGEGDDCGLSQDFGRGELMC